MELAKGATMAVSSGACSAYTYTPLDGGIVSIKSTTRLRSECDGPHDAAQKVLRGEAATVMGSDAVALRTLLMSVGREVRAVTP